MQAASSDRQIIGDRKALISNHLSTPETQVEEDGGKIKRGEDLSRLDDSIQIELNKIKNPIERDKVRDLLSTIY